MPPFCPPQHRRYCRASRRTDWPLAETLQMDYRIKLRVRVRKRRRITRQVQKLSEFGVSRPTICSSTKRVVATSRLRELHWLETRSTICTVSPSSQTSNRHSLQSQNAGPRSRSISPARRTACVRSFNSVPSSSLPKRSSARWKK